MGAPHPLVAIGVDVGGTKTQIVTEDAGGTVADLVVPSTAWRHGALFADPDNLHRLVDLLRGRGALTPRSVLAAGIHDCDTDEQMDQVTTALSTGLGCRVTVVNDAHLLRYATEHRDTIEMIVGTGAIVSGTTADGHRVAADGHGWPVGDHGSAPTWCSARSAPPWTPPIAGTTPPTCSTRGSAPPSRQPGRRSSRRTPAPISPPHAGGGTR